MLSVLGDCGMCGMVFSITLDNEYANTNAIVKFTLLLFLYVGDMLLHQFLLLNQHWLT